MKYIMLKTFRDIRETVDLFQQLEHELARLIVERARRLVAQQQQRVFRHRARYRDALLLDIRFGQRHNQVQQEAADAVPQGKGRVRLSVLRRFRHASPPSAKSPLVLTSP